MVIRSLVLSLLIITTLPCKSQEQVVVEEDLQSDWFIYVNNEYVDFDSAGSPVQTIYIQVQAKKYKSEYLEVAGKNKFAIFLNGQIIFGEEQKVRISIDSLLEKHTTSTFLLSVHQSEDITQSNLTTKIIRHSASTSTSDDVAHSPRQKTFFRDVALTAILVLLIFLISIIRINPRLSSDYFSFTKIFSLRDTETDQFYYRLTSGAILFYAFTSLITGFYLIVINQFADTGLREVQLTGYFHGLWIWFEVSIAVFILLFIKLSIVYLVSSLFGVREIAGFHFFNFIRLMLVLMGLFTLVLTFYYILHGQQQGFYSFMYKLVSWILIGWVALLFVKLVNRVQHAVFHIFSYICATEIIPFLLIVKLLNE